MFTLNSQRFCSSCHYEDTTYTYEDPYSQGKSPVDVLISHGTPVTSSLYEFRVTVTTLDTSVVEEWHIEYRNDDIEWLVRMTPGTPLVYHRSEIDVAPVSSITLYRDVPQEHILENGCRTAVPHIERICLRVASLESPVTGTIRTNTHAGFYGDWTAISTISLHSI